MIHKKKCLHDGTLGGVLEDSRKTIKSAVFAETSDSSSPLFTDVFAPIAAHAYRPWLTAMAEPADDPMFSSTCSLHMFSFLTLPVSHSAELDISEWKSYKHIWPDLHTVCFTFCQFKIKSNQGFYLLYNNLTHVIFWEFICKIRHIRYYTHSSAMHSAHVNLSLTCNCKK